LSLVIVHAFFRMRNEPKRALMHQISVAVSAVYGFDGDERH
jgi:hypothetical protein